MATLDFVACIAVMVGAGIAGFFGVWWITLLFFMLFLLLIANISLHYLQQPLPRYILNANIIDDPELVEEIEEKLKEKE